MCLGQEDAADLRPPLRLSESDGLLDGAIHEAIARKPKGHDFIIDRRHNRPAVSRHMSVTGGGARPVPTTPRRRARPPPFSPPPPTPAPPPPPPPPPPPTPPPPQKPH